MTKEKQISIRLDTDTEHKLQFLLEDANSGDISYPLQTITDIIERCIHNEWVCINQANLAWQEDCKVDENYIKLMKERVQ